MPDADAKQSTELGPHGRPRMTDEQKAKMAAGRARAKAEKAHAEQAAATAEADAVEAEAEDWKAKYEELAAKHAARRQEPIPGKTRSGLRFDGDESLEPAQDVHPVYTPSIFEKKPTDLFVFDHTAVRKRPEMPLEADARTHTVGLRAGQPAVPFKFLPGQPTRIPVEYALRLISVFRVQDITGRVIEAPPEQPKPGEEVSGHKLEPNETVAKLTELTTEALYNRCKKQINSDTITLATQRGTLIEFLIERVLQVSKSVQRRPGISRGERVVVPQYNSRGEIVSADYMGAARTPAAGGDDIVEDADDSMAAAMLADANWDEDVEVVKRSARQTA